jgi:hypothetical protein
MKLILKFSALLAALSAFSAVAQQHENFAQRPEKRQEKVHAAHEKADRNKHEARQWARERGLNMRYEDGTRFSELMAIRDGKPVYYITDNDDAAMSTATDAVRDTGPYNVSGSGVTVGIWDGGLVYSAHREFAGRIVFEESDDGETDHYHATHVGGTIGASGITARATGMAPNVDIRSYAWDDDISEMTQQAASYPDSGGPGRDLRSTRRAAGREHSGVLSVPPAGSSRFSQGNSRAAVSVSGTQT